MVRACVVAAALLLASCTVSRTFILGDGSTLTHPFHPGGDPMPGENLLVRVIGAVPVVRPGTGADKRAHVHWGFVLAMKTQSVSEIAITDVSSKKFVTVVRQADPTFKDGYWGWNAEQRLAAPETLPWLYRSGDSIAIFRIDVTDADGKTETIYQPSRVSEAVKKEILIVVENINAKVK
jgi:hypothetical protein